MINEHKDQINASALAVTTASGILGALTGLPVIQAIAYLPAAFEKLVLSRAGNDIGSKLLFELREAIKKTNIELKKTLEKENPTLAFVFQYADHIFEAETEHTIDPKKINLHIIEEWLHNNVKKELRLSGAYYTDSDIKTFVGKFSDEFAKQVSEYPELTGYLGLIFIKNHEDRLRELEDFPAFVDHHTDDLTIRYNDLGQYKEKYEEVLFLHKNLPQNQAITLKNIFTLPAVEAHINQARTTKRDYNYAYHAIYDFLHHQIKESGDQSADILFIEGQAAMGKSSLVAWLSWHYYNQTSIARRLFSAQRLIVIRLRDILLCKNTLDVQAPFEDIYMYLLGEESYLHHNKREKIGKTLLSNSVLILDGFDELCMVDSITGIGKDIYFLNMYRELKRLDCSCKVIITTRPNYLPLKSLDFPKWHFIIQPFKEDKRKIWITKYDRIIKIPQEIKKSLLDKQDGKLECLLEAPLTLYMITAKKICLSGTINLWKLYHSIFSEEIYVRNYDKEGPHSINEYKDFLQALTTEIAYALSGEMHFFSTIEKLLEISQIRDLVKKLEGIDSKNQVDYNQLEKVLTDCFGVASYFKTMNKKNAQGVMKNAVEFFHNNIKDYFACEYIWAKMQKIYRQIPVDETAMERWFIQNYQSIFQFSVFMKDASFSGEPSVIVQFFRNKILYYKENGIEEDFVNQELENHYLERFLGKMLQTGVLFHYDFNGKENILSMISNIYTSILAIYHSIYVPYLEDNNRMSITKSEYITDISTSFIFRLLFITANIHNQSHIDGIMFSQIDMDNHNFSYCSFRNCIMIKTSIQNCDLRGVDFSGADLSYADLRHSIIDETTCFINTVFKLTLISEEQLRFMGKQPESALLIC